MAACGASNAGPSASTSSFRITDPELIEAALRDTFGSSMRLTGSQHGYLFAHQRLAAGSLVVDRMSSSGFSVDLEPLTGLHLVTGVRGVVDRSGSGESDRIGPGQTVLSLPGRSYRCDWSGDNATVQAVVLDPALLSAVAANDPAATAAPVRFTSTQAVTPAAEQTWRHTVDQLVGTVLSESWAAASPLIIGGVSRLLAGLALTSFPNTAVPASRVAAGRDAIDATPATLRRAIAYIEANADLDVSAADIAAAAGVTVRAVQLAFRRHLDTTPMAHLRRIRLTAAHAQLREAMLGDGTTVTGVAARWGFASSSRFAALYRDAYAVSPSHTLGRARQERRS